MAKNKWKILLICLMIPVMLAGITRAAVFTYTDEAGYLNHLVSLGYSSFHEGFENDDVWGSARSPATASEVTSLGITWTSNHPLTNNITTGPGAAVSGDWGVFDLSHGSATGTPQECDVDNPPSKCLPHDGFSGTRVDGGSTLYGIGGWFSGISGAKINFILNLTDIIGFDTPIGNPVLQPQFFGVIETAGFRKYEVREIDGKIGQELFIFGDDFTFAVSSDSCIPSGSADTNCDGIDDDCNGVVDEGYLPDSSCGVGICRTNNTPSGCVGGVEIVCQEGLSVLEDTDPVCSDSLDNDCDGLVDSADPSCPGDPLCTPTGSVDTNCDGIDDDCNGVVDDGYVPNGSCGVGICRTNNTPSSCVGGVEMVCQEGLPVPEDGEPVCSDSLDNDCDGQVDSADSSCTGEKLKFPWTLYMPVILGAGNNRGN